MFCKNCGKQLLEVAGLCSACGSRVESRVSTKLWLLMTLGFAVGIALVLIVLLRPRADDVGKTLSQVQGLMVVRENAPSPVVSDLPADMEQTLRRIPGVRVVAPEVFKIAPPAEGRSPIARSAFDQEVIQGQDIPSHRLLMSAVFPSKLLPPEQGGGRFLEPGDRGKPHIVISRKIARSYPNADGTPKKVGETLRIGDRPYTIVGIYDTGSLFLDLMIIMDIDTARELLGINKDTVSSFYVEAEDNSRLDALAEEIERRLSEVDARRL